MHWDRRCQDFEMFFLCYRVAKYKCKCNAIGLFAICHNVGIKFDQFVLVLGDLVSQSFQIHIPHFSIQTRLSHFVTGMLDKITQTSVRPRGTMGGKKGWHQE